MKKNGFTVIEILIVVGVIGLLTLAIYPSINNSQESRELENAAKDVLMTLQWAKFQAVNTKMNHRVGFAYDSGGWVFCIEKEESPNVWNSLPGQIRKKISSRFQVAINLPDQNLVFSPLGMVPNFSSSQNSITIQSTKLKQYNQADQRVIKVFASGSLEFIKSWS